MRLALLLLAATLGDPAADVVLAPAPGAPPVSSVLVDGATLALDAAGRGRIARGAKASAEGLRFYSTPPNTSGGEQAFYYPADGTLVTWPLAGLDAGSAAGAAASARVVIKDHAETWENARSHAAPLETDGARRNVRFVLPPGSWDAAILAPGWAPGFATSVAAKGKPVELAATSLQRSGRVKARVLDARSGKPPQRWEAYVARIGGDPKLEETKFFEKRPISEGQAALDFASLPVGGWELKIAAPGRSEPHLPVKVAKGGALEDLGDVYVTDFGKLRVVLEFPGEVPPGSFAVNLTRSRVEFEAPPIDLGSRTVTVKGDTTVEFEAIEPGEVDIEIGNQAQLIRRETSAQVEPNKTTEARLVLRPVNVHGIVRRGDKGEAGAAVSAPVGRREGWKSPDPVISDELGAYALKTWGGRDTIFLETVPRGEEVGFGEWVKIEPTISDLEHDVKLPGAEIRGVVRDAESGAAIAGAEVQFSTAIPETITDPENYTAFYYTVASDDEGRFRLASLGEELVDVGVESEGYAPSRFPSVQPTPEGTELDVRLERGRRLTGVVIDESGGPVGGATVGLDVDAQGYSFARTATTSAGGHYEFRGVGSGLHVLGVFRCGHALAIRPFSMPDSDDESAGRTEDIRLEPEPPPIQLVVEKGDGNPARTGAFRWSVNGFTLPSMAWTEAATACGHAAATNEIGRLVLHGFPAGTITALSLWTREVLGTFDNDGSTTEWTIRLPGEPHVEAVQQAVR